MTSYVYPNGCDGQTLSACHANFWMSSAEATVENAMNIAKLQYCQGVTDITHDYMVVDMFQDSNGWNDTVCDPSCYTTGLYGVGTCTSGGGAAVGDYCVCTNASGNPDTNCAIGWASFVPTCYDRVKEFGYCLTCFGCYCADPSGGCGCLRIGITCSEDNLACCDISCTLGSSESVTVMNVTNCYCYICDSANCWDFYCNGTCKCQVTRTAFPPTCVDVFAYTNTASVRTISRVVEANYYYCDDLQTTSQYFSSGLNGYYTNVVLDTITWCGFQTCCVETPGALGTASACYGDYCAYVQTTVGTNALACSETCICANNLDLANQVYVCFCARCYVCNCNVGAEGTATSCYTITASHDNSNCAGTNMNVTNCYEYCRDGATCCWDFYKNGVCVCQVDLTGGFPNILISTCGSTSGTYHTKYTYALVEYGDIFAHCGAVETKIMVCETQYENPISTVYLTDEQTGIGTAVYNVVNATTGSCIACDVPLNCLYPMTCCVCCHKYEIVQCSDNYTCIKSYALLAGEA